jgi:tRNA U55 pseudouridine synthase TruB
MAKIVQVLTRPSKEYDYTVAESQTRDLDGIIVKLNTTYQQELKDEVEAQNFFLN